MGKHIVISINASWNIYNFRAGLIRALLAQGHRVTALAPEDAFSAKLVDMGCEFRALPMDNKGTSPLRDAALYRAYKRALRDLMPDAMLCYTIKPNIYGTRAAHALGIPVINNVSGLGTVFIKKSIVTTIAKRLYRWAFRTSKHVFFQNADDQQLFLDHGLVPNHKTSLLPGSGIDLTTFVTKGPSPSDPPKTFLMIARLLKDKGIFEYVEAARQIRAEMPDARFQVLGFLDVDNRTAVTADQMDAWLADGAIEYLGATEDVRPYIESADCVVLPSYREGTPRTLLEAAALSRPLIATDVPGCREVVKDGYNGFLCRVRDADDLARCFKAMQNLDRATYTAMSNNSRTLVEQTFDEKFVIEEYLKVLNQ